MNLLIALMGNTYNVISAISDKEWKKQVNFFSFFEQNHLA